MSFKLNHLVFPKRLNYDNREISSKGIYVFLCEVCVCVFIKLHITAQSGPVILVILCHSH